MVIIFDPEVPSGSRSLWFLALSSLLISPSSGAALEARDGVPAGYVAAPYYPTPHGGWADDWEGSYAKAVELVSQMTLAEKTNITAGSGFFMGPCVGNTGSALRVGFPQLCLQDGPLGVRSTDNVTAFPAGITTGATFSKSLMYERGVALGEEFKGKGANMYLGPSVGPLGRKPRGGRNWEAFGSDPVLQGVAGAQTIKGVQEQGVIAVLKHLIGNEQEMWRMYNPFQPAYSSNIDDRTMHELYLWPFAEGVHAGTGAAMISYNAVNGSADSQNSYNINGLLKDELGFQGLVMTDWLAHLSGVDSALSGLDMDMPGDTQIPLFGNSYWMYELTRSALNGSVPMDRLNDMATRIVATWYKMGQDQDYPEPNFSSNTRDREGPLYPGALLSPSGVVNQYVNVQAEHKVVAKQVAQEAVTLLKNNGSFLPITTTVSLSVFGTDAQADPQGINSCTDKSCNRGTLGMGWGSGSADYPYMDDPISSLKRKAGTVTYYATDSFPTVPMPSDDDVAIVFISSDSGENSYTVENNHGDRDTDGLKAWHGGDALVQKAAAKYNNVIVVVHTVGPIIMEPWIDLPSVKAVLVAHLPGQEAGDSLTEILFGEVSPSGHLPYSIPVAESDYPSSVSNLVGFAVGQPQDTYSEGLYIDYRSLNKQKIRARFAFGHGLSYASFNFSSISITPVTSLSTVPPTRPVKSTSPIATMNTTIPSASEAVAPAGFNMIWRYLYSWLSESDANAAYAEGQSGAVYAYPAGYSTKQKVGPPAGGPNGGNPALWDVAYTVSVTVINTGETNHSGKAVPQAYVQFPSGMPYDTPVIQLRDFEKTGSLAPGESEAVELSITRKDLSVWDVELQNWVAPGAEGQYKIWVGEASDDLGVVCYTDSLRCEVGFAGPV